jgi:hypothetical protein
MTQDILEIIASKNIKLQPVIDTKGKLEHWSAGYIEVTPQGQNIVNVYERGPSPLAAVQALIQKHPRRPRLLLR